MTDALIDFTPELRAEAEQLMLRYRTGPVFTPTVVSDLDGRSRRFDRPAARTGRVGRMTRRRRSSMHRPTPPATMTATGVRDAMLRAYDKATGAEVGAVYMPAQQSGSPMTYMVDGAPYIVVAISGGVYSGEYRAFKLPGYRGSASLAELFSQPRYAGASLSSGQRSLPVASTPLSGYNRSGRAAGGGAPFFPLPLGEGRGQGKGTLLTVIAGIEATSYDPTTGNYSQYEVTITDPTTWTRSWTVMIPLMGSDDAISEYACHEGNIGMEDMLAGHRAEEREAAAQSGSQ